jgi:hypothetical protein
MAKEPAREPSSRKGRYQVSVSPRFRKPLERLAERRATEPADEVHRAILDLLVAEGLWPLTEENNS